MNNSLSTMLTGYRSFREKYAHGDESVMHCLSRHGQKPKTMVIACCDSRVDPALILQCDPGDLFVARNVANIVPPYERDEAHHGTSAALEFGVCYLQVEHLILLGHSQCGGIQALMDKAAQDQLKDSQSIPQNDFIDSWMSLVSEAAHSTHSVDECAKTALQQSYGNCLTFPWIKDKIERGQLTIHLWFFDIKAGQIYSYCHETKNYQSLY